LIFCSDEKKIGRAGATTTTTTTTTTQKQISAKYQQMATRPSVAHWLYRVIEEQHYFVVDAVAVAVAVALTTTTLMCQTNFYDRTSMMTSRECKFKIF